VRRLVILLIAAVFVLALVLYMVAYTVRFTERAVVTTFGRATESEVVQPGLHFKWPYPIQRVMTYDTRVRVFQTRQETQQTLDNRQLVVQAFCTWRVSDPLQFFRRFSNAGERPIDHFREAEQSLDSSMRTAMSAVSSYRIDQLFTSGDAESSLPDLERQILESMKRAVEGAAPGEPASGEPAPGEMDAAEDVGAPGPAPTRATTGAFGVEIVSVGIARVQLPQDATEAVFERITAAQDAQAQAISSRAEAERDAIVSRAQSTAAQIRAFADRRADQIVALGELESARFLAQMAVEPELAVFIQQMEFISEMYAHRVTLVLPTSMPGFGPLNPSYLDGVAPGGLPSSGFPAEWSAAPSNEVPTAATPPAGGDDRRAPAEGNP
jgi:membrane protease subunit HflC